jgi:hypothetical protein
VISELLVVDGHPQVGDVSRDFCARGFSHPLDVPRLRRASYAPAPSHPCRWPIDARERWVVGATVSPDVASVDTLPFLGTDRRPVDLLTSNFSLKKSVGTTELCSS